MLVISKVMFLLVFGFRFRKDPFVKNGNLEFGTMRNILKGGCHRG
jgi:hypothetical protein